MYTRNNIESDLRKQYITYVGLSNSEIWADKYASLKGNATAKGVKCILTFVEYIDLAIEAGINDPSSIVDRSIHIKWVDWVI
jgi:hypothetical protein